MILKCQIGNPSFVDDCPLTLINGTLNFWVSVSLILVFRLGFRNLLLFERPWSRRVIRVDCKSPQSHDLSSPSTPPITVEFYPFTVHLFPLWRRLRAERTLDFYICRIYLVTKRCKILTRERRYVRWWRSTIVEFHIKGVERGLKVRVSVINKMFINC